jgi:hypothetical protein
MAQRLLSIPGIYWSVLCALARTVLGIVLWGIFNTITGLSSREVQNAEPVYDGGLGWLLYAIATLALVCVLASYGAPRWLVDFTIAASVLGVLPIHWAFHRDAPSGRTLEDGIGDLPSAAYDEFLNREAVEVLQPYGADAAARDGEGVAVRGKGRR